MIKFTLNEFKQHFNVMPFVGQRLEFKGLIVEVDSIHNQAVAITEYTLEEFAQKLTDEKHVNSHIVTMTEFDTDNINAACHSYSHICLNDKALRKTLTDIFSNELPDNSMTRHYVSESPLIAEYLDDIYSPENFQSNASTAEEHETLANRAKQNAFSDIIDNNSPTPLLQYLLETFDIIALVDDAFFCNAMNYGLKSISYESVEIIK